MKSCSSSFVKEKKESLGVIATRALHVAYTMSVLAGLSLSPQNQESITHIMMRANHEVFGVPIILQGDGVGVGLREWG